MTSEKQIEFAETPKDIASNYLLQFSYQEVVRGSKAQQAAEAIRDGTYDKTLLPTDLDLRHKFADALLEDLDALLPAITSFNPLEKDDTQTVTARLQDAASLCLGYALDESHISSPGESLSSKEELYKQAQAFLKDTETPDAITAVFKKLNADNLSILILKNDPVLGHLPATDLRKIFADRLVFETRFAARVLKDNIRTDETNRLTNTASSIARSSIDALYTLHFDPTEKQTSIIQDGIKETYRQRRNLAVADISSLAYLAFKQVPKPPLGIPVAANI